MAELTIGCQAKKKRRATRHDHVVVKGNADEQGGWGGGDREGRMAREGVTAMG